MKAKGTFTQFDNWVLRAVAELSLASDIKILLRLAEQANYRKPSMGTAVLADELNLDIRTVQQACARLVKAGHILSLNGEHCLCGACTAVAQRLHKSTRPPRAQEAAQHEKNPPLKEGKERKEEEGKEEVRVLVGNPLPEPEGHTPAQPPSTFQESYQQLIQILGREAAKSALNVGGGQAAVMRWIRDYPVSFLLQAWQLAPVWKATYGKDLDVYVFVGWLNRERRFVWPQELTDAYTRLSCPDTPEPDQQAQQPQTMADILSSLPLNGATRWSA